jgi:hypothetical protein
MRECLAPSKLLILDLARTGADERFDVFADDIAANVQAALAGDKNPRFSVLCACSPGQRAQVSEELGQSLFAYYLDQGLRGHAEGYAKGNRDLCITVSELADFVKEHVDRCAWITRGVRQTPVLTFHGADFTLVRFEEAALANDVESKPPESYPAWLGAAWEVRDKWRTDQSRLGPGVLRELEAWLLRTERRWRGGIEEKRLKEELAPAQKRFQAQTQRIVASSLPPLPRSLILAIPANQKATAAFPGAIDNLLSRVPDPGLKIDDKEAAKQADVLDKEIKATLALVHDQPAAAANVLFESVAAWPKLGRGHVLVLDQLLRNLPLKTRYVQTVFLERVADHVAKTKDRNWPLATMQQALRTLRESERALAEVAQEPAVLPWVKSLFQDADEARRAGETKLFYGRPKDWTNAGEKLVAAETLYLNIQARAEALRRARMTRDRALALLPTFAPMLLAFPKENIAEMNTWHDAARGAAALTDALAEPGHMPEGVVALGEQLAQLQRFFDKKVERCLDLGEYPSGEDYQEIQALLESPWLTGPRRQDLWKAGQKLAFQFLSEIKPLDKADKPGKPSGTTVLGPDRGLERAQLQKRLRFQQAIDMIHLTGYYKQEKELQASLDQVDKETWTPLAEKLAALWPRRFLADLKAGVPDMLKVDRLERVLSPFDLNGVKSTDESHWSRNPTLAVYRKDLAAFWRWLGDRYQADGEALDADSRFRADYREWAEQHRTRAITMP